MTPAKCSESSATMKHLHIDQMIMAEDYPRLFQHGEIVSRLAGEPASILATSAAIQLDSLCNQIFLIIVVISSLAEPPPMF